MGTDAFVKALGKAIQAQRRACGLTQEALAEAIDSSAEWISQVERGVGCPSIPMLVEIAAALGVEPAAFLQDAASSGQGPAEADELRLLVRKLEPSALRVLLATAKALHTKSGGG